MKNILNEWLLSLDDETLQLALDSIYDSSVFRSIQGKPDIVIFHWDLTLQKQLFHLANCEWDRTLAALTWYG